MDFALSSVAAVVQLGADKTVRQVGLVLGGVAPIPWRASAAEQFLVGKSLSAEVRAEAGRLALQGAQPLEKNAYKVPLTQTLIRRALAKTVGE